MNFKERLLLFINTLPGGQGAFEESVGLSNGAVNNIRRGMREETVSKILTKYPQLNRIWLLTGEGEMLLPSGRDTYTEQRRNKKSGIVAEADGMHTINPMIVGHHGKMPVKYFDTDFAAGNSVVFYEDNIEFPAYEMNIPTFSGCIAFNVFGDSMEPIIKAGSVCFGRKLDDWHEHLDYGQIFGIVLKNGHRYLKYIRKSDDPDKFLLKSANDNYDDFEIPKHKIHNIWLIDGWMLKRT